MTRPIIPTLSPRPLPTDSGEVFVSKADETLSSIPPFTEGVNLFEDWVESAEGSSQTNKQFAEDIKSEVQGDFNQISSDNTTIKSNMDDSQLYLNSTISELNDVEYKALALKQFSGVWNTLTGSFPQGYSVLHNGSYYVSLSTIADITLSEPSISSNWEELIGVGDVPIGVVGDILFTTDDLTSSTDWLLCDGAVYLKTEYPELSDLYYSLTPDMSGTLFDPNTEFPTPLTTTIETSIETAEGWKLPPMNVYIRTNTNAGQE